MRLIILSLVSCFLEASLDVSVIIIWVSILINSHCCSFNNFASFFFFLLWEKSFFHWQLGNIIRKLLPTATGNSWWSGHLWSECWTWEWSYMWLEDYVRLQKLTPYFHRKIMIITIRMPGAIKLSLCCRGQWYVEVNLSNLWVNLSSCVDLPHAFV